jgi:hypothetical protein
MLSVIAAAFGFLAVQRETAMIAALVALMVAGVFVAVAAIVLLGRERGRR